MVEFAYPAAAVLLGYIVLGMTGFGSALVAVPLLAWRWPLPEVVALVLMLDVPASILHGGLNLRRVDIGELKRLLPGMLVGIAAGLWAVGVLDPKWPLLCLGLYIAAVGADTLRSRHPVRRSLPAPLAHAMGFMIGLVEMLFGTAGPLVVAWLSRRLTNVHVLRASTPVIIVVGASGVLVAMALAGRLSDGELWLRWISLIGFAALGVAVGNRIARQVPSLILRRIIALLLVCSGLGLALHAWA